MTHKWLDPKNNHRLSVNSDGEFITIAEEFTTSTSDKAQVVNCVSALDVTTAEAEWLVTALQEQINGHRN